MNRVIPSGAYCLFRHPVAGSRNGRVVLAQHHDIGDPDTGGQYTVKRYERTKIQDDDGGWHHERISLVPATTAPGYEPILLDAHKATGLRVIAELVEVLPGGDARDR